MSELLDRFWSENEKLSRIKEEFDALSKKMQEQEEVIDLLRATAIIESGVFSSTDWSCSISTYNTKQIDITISSSFSTEKLLFGRLCDIAGATYGKVILPNDIVMYFDGGNVDLKFDNTETFKKFVEQYKVHIIKVETLVEEIIADFDIAIYKAKLLSNMGYLRPENKSNRHFDRIMFFGENNVVKDKLLLHCLLDNAMTLIGGLQQPPHSYSLAQAKQAKEDFDKGLADLNDIVKDIVMALTGQEISL